MDFLTSSDYYALMELIESNNQYNKEDDIEYWNEILAKLNIASSHSLDA
jgi:hypothetical protein